MPKKFKYRGDSLPGITGNVKTGGRILAFRFHGKDGKTVEVKSADPNGFKKNDVIDVPDDPRILRHMRKNTAFLEQ